MQFPPLLYKKVVDIPILQSHTAAVAPRWSASTKSSSMRQLVADREKVFAAQRLFQITELQMRSEQVKEDSFSHLSETNLVPRYSFRAYKHFCDDVKVPPFPITPALLALSLFAKCSAKDIYYLTFVKDLQKIANTTRGVWEDIEGFDDLDEWAGSSAALSEFLEERKGKRVKRPRKRAGQPVSTKEAMVVVSEAESSEDDTRGTLKRHAPSSSESSARFTSTSGSASDGGSDSEGLSEERGAGERRARLGRPAPPSVSPVNESYPSFNALYIAFVRYLVLSTGISCQVHQVGESSGDLLCNRGSAARYNPSCSWHISAFKDSRTSQWKVDFAASNLKHNHPPAAKFLKNPSWMPTVRNEDARKALGLPPLSRRKTKIPVKKAEKRSFFPTGNIARPQKKKRASKTASATMRSSTSFSETPPTDSLQARASIGFSTLLPVQHIYVTPLPSTSRVQLSGLPSSQGQNPTIYATGPAPSSHVAHSSFTVWPASNSPPFLANLTAFLVSIHPSFSSLASAFFTAGLNSLDALVLLTLMEPETVRSFISVISAQRHAGGSGISGLQAKLLVKGLRVALGN
ncbi:hypothetical protein JCM11251_004463 [Rhodosporidiobolus azoricus]